MNDSAKITAVLCNYNGGIYLKEAIESVLAQERMPEEFIIVDDKSTDNSVEIIHEIQCKHPGLISLIEFPENKGQAAGMNTAFESSTGELITFLDSDDFWDPGKLTAVCEAYQSHPDFGLFQHNLKILKVRQESGELFWPAMTQGDAFALWIRKNRFPNFSPTSGLAIRREVFAKLYPIPETLSISADSYMTRTAICFGPLISNLKPYGVYRQHDTNNVFGNQDHDAWKYFVVNVAPHLAAFYQYHGFEIPPQVRPKSPVQPKQKKHKRRSFLDRILDLNIRKIVKFLQDLSLRNIFYKLRSFRF